MRLIFLSLIVFNLIAFAVALVTRSDSAEAQYAEPRPNPYTRYPQLTLLSELDEIDNRSLGADEIQREPRAGAAAIPSVSELCELVGPFPEVEGAAVFVERLAAIEIRSAQVELEFPSGPGYWLILAPSATKREALRLLADVQSKDIDSYIIPKGELENGISLGMFSNRELAIERMASLRAKGVEPELRETERTYRENWVRISPEQSRKMSDLSWQRSLEGIEGVERRQNYCEDVASQ